jgi:hypothetical protein
MLNSSAISRVVLTAKVAWYCMTYGNRIRMMKWDVVMAYNSNISLIRKPTKASVRIDCFWSRF